MNKKSKGLVTISVLVAFFIGQLLTFSIVSSYEPTFSPEKLYQDKISAIINIYAIQASGSEKNVAGGTGFFVSKEGLIVTAAHVIYDDGGHPNANKDLADNVCNFIFIKTNDRKFYTVKPVKVDLQHDIAILKISKTLVIKNTNGPLKDVKFIEGKEVKKEFPVLELVRIDKPLPGQTVMSIGFPGRYHTLIAVGIVSSPIAQSSAMEEEDLTFKDLVLTSMLIFPGNSGGPVFNKHGKVVGIATLGSDQGASVSLYQRTKYIKRLLENKTSKLVVYTREPYDKEYDR